MKEEKGEEILKKGSLPQRLPTKKDAEKVLDIAKSVFQRTQEVLEKS
jgi:hypothetical protein